ncbi:arginine--tRNA ligase [Elusimicrobiota bacterium]
MLKNTFKKEINKLISPWLKKKGILEIPSYTLNEPPKNIAGDLATNLPILISKQLKSNPKMVAEEISKLTTEKLPNIVKEVSIAGAGFLNIHFSDEIIFKLFNEILTKKDDFGRNEDTSKEKILIEFVSANPTGPLHIGHGRGAAIGDSLARIYKHLGYVIDKEYYLNDCGNQIDILGLSLEARYKELKGEKISFPEGGYNGQYITEIARNLLKGKKDKIDFKQIALDEILKIIKNDLKDFNVSFDTWFSESEIAKKPSKDKKSEVEMLCDLLEKNGFAYKKDGALWFESSKYGDDKDRVLKRSDGRYTYLASDIAYHKNKLSRGYSKLINLWGADHHGYIARMKAAIGALNSKPETLTVILYQLVSLVRSGVPVSMSTRSGEFITLEEVIQEVGKDACRFSFMLRAPDSQLEFDLELAKKKSSENPVFYVQYVYARCSSIFKEYEAQANKKLAFTKNSNFSLLKTVEEMSLIKKLLFFPDVLGLCIRNLSPHYLTTYLMEVADIYHRFYEKCRVLNDNDDLTMTRLSLLEAVRIVIKNGLSLIGVSTPEKM